MKYLLLVVTFLGFLSGCASLNVKQDFDMSTDFEKLKTYTWIVKETYEPEDNSLLAESVSSSADPVLVKKGCWRNHSGVPDFFVTYKYSITKTSGSASGMNVSRAPKNAEMETLGIDLINPLSLKLLWRGSVEKELKRYSNPKKTAKKIKKLVKTILSKFPPEKPEKK